MSIRVHYSWIPVFIVITAIVTTQFTEGYSLLRKIILGAVVSLLFLLAATIRELIISVAAFRTDTPSRKITLFPFGGVYQESRDTVISTHLPLLFLARYLSTLVIAVIFYGLYATFINTGNVMLAGITQWLTYIFFAVFLIHIIPAFPLDGGQILRMIILKSSGDYYKATRIAGLIGLAVGLLLIFTGVMEFIVTQRWMISLLIIIIGWTVQMAAGNSRRKINTLIALQRIQAHDIMTAEYPSMSPQMNIGQLVREYILLKGWNYVVVVNGVKVEGILTAQRIKSIPLKRWASTTIADIMAPSDSSVTASPQQTADVLLEEMDRWKLDYLPVMQEDRLIGVISRDALIGWVKTRAGFGF